MLVDNATVELSPLKQLPKAFVSGFSKVVIAFNAHHMSADLSRAVLTMAGANDSFSPEFSTPRTFSGFSPAGLLKG